MKPAEPPLPLEENEADEALDIAPEGEILIVRDGMEDIFNLYPWTVMVSAKIVIPGRGRKVMICSGLLVSERVVLTAGHCVCSPRTAGPEGRVVIDKNSQCAKRAEVRLLRYQPKGVGEVTEAEDVSAKWSSAYRGFAVPHEDLEVVYASKSMSDKKARTIKSNADLAVVILEKSLEEERKLLEKERKYVYYLGHAGPVLHNENDTIEISRRAKDTEVILVGIGANGHGEDAGVNRRFGSNDIISVKSDRSTFTLGQQSMISETYEGEFPLPEGSVAADLLPGDSGGPCLKAGKVIGIAKSATQDKRGFLLSTCTTLLPHLEWLRKKIEQAEPRAPPAVVR
jgi:hypothetical protein